MGRKSQHKYPRAPVGKDLTSVDSVALRVPAIWIGIQTVSIAIDSDREGGALKSSVFIAVVLSTAPTHVTEEPPALQPEAHRACDSLPHRSRTSGRRFSQPASPKTSDINQRDAMALVAYSDSESSDTELPSTTPQPAAPAKAKAPPFQKPEARKIKVALPSLQAEAESVGISNAGDEPPAKRARTAGAFGGFNSLLPAPKRAAAAAQAKTGLGRAVSLRTSSEAAFSRVVEGVGVAQGGGVGGEVRSEEEGGGHDEFGVQTRAAVIDESGGGEKAGMEAKVVGKATRFKPLSVVNKRKKTGGAKKAVAAPAAAATTDTHIADDDVRKSATEGGAIPQDVAPVVPKPKRSLFAVDQEEEEPLLEQMGGGYTALQAPEPAHAPAVYPQQSTIPAPAPPPNPLEALAQDMNLTPSQRRQLFGRSSLANPHNPTLVHFNTDTEYAANESLRQSTGETEAHRAVKTVAPGKHSLQQLVNNARVNQEGIEDKWAEGRRKRGEGGSAYGWGK
ncbi:hypothetical protein LTR75_008459 [Friedmanniomyces endolithicus]|nr:hypothetical protein LTR75_008459 [Friedmanniomyces endolithicus]